MTRTPQLLALALALALAALAGAAPPAAAAAAAAAAGGGSGYALVCGDVGCARPRAQGGAALPELATGGNLTVAACRAAAARALHPRFLFMGGDRGQAWCLGVPRGVEPALSLSAESSTDGCADVAGAAGYAEAPFPKNCGTQSVPGLHAPLLPACPAPGQTPCGGGACGAAVPGTQCCAATEFYDLPNDECVAECPAAATATGRVCSTCAGRVSAPPRSCCLGRVHAECCERSEAFVPEDGRCVPVTGCAEGFEAVSLVPEHPLEFECRQPAPTPSPSPGGGGGGGGGGRDRPSGAPASRPRSLALALALAGAALALVAPP